MSLDLSMVIKGKKASPPRLVIYGVPGIGKSSFASDAPDPIFINIEDRLDHIDTNKFPKATSYAAVMEQIALLTREPHSYKTLVVDTIDWFEPLIWDKICSDHKTNNIEDIGYGKGYIMALDPWREFFDALNNLREKKKMAIILIAHEHIRRFDSPESEPFDRYELKLHPKAAALCYEWADAVMFANYKASIAKTDVGFKKEIKRGIGGGERFLYTEERPAYKAKNSYGLPHSILYKKDEGWATFMAAMANNFKQDKGTKANG